MITLLKTLIARKRIIKTSTGFTPQVLYFRWHGIVRDIDDYSADCDVGIWKQVTRSDFTFQLKYCKVTSYEQAEKNLYQYSDLVAERKNTIKKVYSIKEEPKAWRILKSGDTHV